MYTTEIISIVDEVDDEEDCVVLPRYPTTIPRTMEILNRDHSAFLVEEISPLITQTVDHVLGTSSYQHKEINRWTADIVEQLLTELTNLNKPFKYIVQAVIMQKNGAGLHVASTCYWNDQTDGSCTVRWDNRHLYAIISVFGLSI